MRTAKQFSPAALTIWEAFNEDEAGIFVDYGEKLAAALEALADQVVPEEPTECQSFTNEAIRLNRMGTRSEILAIVAELLGSSQPTSDSV